MIEEVRGSMFKLAPVGSVVGIPVNTVAVAGKGLALYMKLTWPDAYEFYVKECRRGRMSNGRLKSFLTPHFNLILLPTKFHWSAPSTVEQVEDTVRRLAEWMRDEYIHVVHIPTIGCGKETGQLRYKEQLRPILEKYFGDEVAPDLKLMIYLME